MGAAESLEARSVVLLEPAPLDDQVADHPVEDRAVVESGLDVGQEVDDRDHRPRTEQLDRDIAHRRLDHDVGIGRRILRVGRAGRGQQQGDDDSGGGQ